MGASNVSFPSELGRHVDLLDLALDAWEAPFEDADDLLRDPPFFLL
jgi:hypothetical protein